VIAPSATPTPARSSIASTPFPRSSLRQLLRLTPAPRGAGRGSVRAFLDDRLDAEQTCVAGVAPCRRPSPGMDGDRWQTHPFPASGSLPTARCSARRRPPLRTAGGQAALALSGARLRPAPCPGRPPPNSVPRLRPRPTMPATARWSVPGTRRPWRLVLVVPATRYFVAALPECIRQPRRRSTISIRFQVSPRPPLHADAFGRRDATGDQVFAGVSAWITCRCRRPLRALGVESARPSSTRLIAFARQHRSDPNKGALRALARGWSTKAVSGPKCRG